MTDTAQSVTRRRFIGVNAAAVVTFAGAPHVVTASRTSNEVIVGDGDYRYRIEHAWPQLPDQYTWQTTHNVAVDSTGNLYVIHEGKEDQKKGTIFLFL